MRALDEFTKRRIVSRYTSSDESVDDLAKIFQVSSRTVHRVIKEKGAEKRAHTPFTAEEEATMVQLYRDGHTSVQIGMRLGCHQWSVLRALRRHGVKARRGRAAHRKDQRLRFA